MCSVWNHMFNITVIALLLWDVIQQVCHPTGKVWVYCVHSLTLRPILLQYVRVTIATHVNQYI